MLSRKLTASEEPQQKRSGEIAFTMSSKTINLNADRKYTEVSIQNHAHVHDEEECWVVEALIDKSNEVRECYADESDALARFHELRGELKS